MEQSQGTGAVGGALQGAATGAAFGPVGAAVGGVVGGVMGFLGGGGEEETEELARKQALEIRRAAKENKRSQLRVANRAVSTAKATTYASNLQDSGSSRRYRDSMETEYRRQISYDSEAANRNAENVINGGQAAGDAIKRAGIGQLVGGIASAGTAAAGMSWGKQEVGAGKLGYAQAGSGGTMYTKPQNSLLQKK
jgi:phage tail tape-measure protein